MSASFEQRVEVVIAGLVCADKHDLDLRFALRVRLFDTAADRKVFRERFGGEPDVGRYLSDALRQPAEQATYMLNAADVVAEPMVLRDVLANAALKALFAVGLEALPPLELSATSSTLRRAGLEAIAVEESARRSATQAAELRRASALLDSFRTTDALPGDLLANVSPAERGGMVQALLRASAAEAEQWILNIVSGNTVSQLHRGQRAIGESFGDEPMEIDPDVLGSLRSITVAVSTLHIGAQFGVWHWHVDSVPIPTRLVADSQSRMGFNGVVGHVQRAVATHHELGAFEWQIPLRSQNAEPVPMTQIAAAPARCPHFLPDGRLLFASGREVLVEKFVVAELPGEVVAVVPVDRRLAIIGADGSVVLLDATTLDVLKRFSVGKAVRHAAGLPWLGSARLVLATDAGVSVVGPDDGLSLDRAVPGGCKVVAATADTIAAVTGDRQRVLLFSTWDASAEPRTIYVTAATRHRVGDLAFSV